MADDSEINLLVNDLNNIMNNILAIDENPDNLNVTWIAIHASITAAIEDMNEIGQQVDEDDEDVAIMVQNIVEAMHLVAEEAEEAEQDGNTNNVRLRLQDVIDAVDELPRAYENIGGYRKRKQRTHRKRRTYRKRRTHRKRRNRKRTHRNRK